MIPFVNKFIMGSLLVVGLISSDQLRAQQPTRISTEKLITRFEPSEMVNKSYSISKDMSHISYRLNSDGKQMTVIDGIKGETYDAVNPSFFSPDGKRFGYAARSGNKWLVVIDNKVEATIDSVSGITSIHFSPDGNSYAYLVNAGRKFYMVSNGVKGKLYDNINENSITFGTDSLTVAYVARRGKNQLIVMDGKEGYSYDEVGFPIISSSGKHLAYWAKKDNQSYAVFDNQASKAYEAVKTIILSPDGKYYAYEAVSQGKHIVITNGIESEKYEVVHSMKYSSDGLKLVYAMETETADLDGYKQYVVMNGKKIGPYETIMEGGLLFSPDGKRFAYKASRHNEFLYVVDGKEGKYYSDVLQVTATFSPDNLRFAYAAELNTKRMVIVDEIENAPFDDVFFVAFTPDSRRLVYTVKKEGKESVAVDGINGKPYDSIMGQGAVVFDSPTSFHYLALKGNEIYLVEEMLE